VEDGARLEQWQSAVGGACRPSAVPVCKNAGAVPLQRHAHMRLFRADAQGVAATSCQLLPQLCFSWLAGMAFVDNGPVSPANFFVSCAAGACWRRLPVWPEMAVLEFQSRERRGAHFGSKKGPHFWVPKRVPDLGPRL
jgi:hypothetical protein